MIVVNSSTRQFNIPGSDLIFGVVADSGSGIKYFQCPRYVGNNLDLASCFVRINYRNANGEMDSHLVEDVAIDGDNVTFSWELAPKVTAYKGQVKFVMCAVGPNLKVKWHTTQGTGQVHEGLEPDQSHVEDETSDVVAQLVTMVEAQTDAVEAEGATQVKAVKAAAEAAEAAAVAEIEAKGVNTRESIPADYTALSEVVDGLTRSRAGAIVCESEGSAVVVSDASDHYIQGLRIFGKSTQTHTPTPTDPAEIVSVEEPMVSVRGKNLIDISHAVRNVSCTTEARNEQLLLTKTNTKISYANVYFSAGAYASYVGRTLTLKITNASEYSWVVRVGNMISNSVADEGNIVRFGLSGGATEIRSFVVPNVSDGGELGIRITGGDNSVSDGSTYVLENIQLEFNNEATNHEPYSNQTVELTHTLPGIPVASGGNYTDSDGQEWICDEVDLERGVYVQRVYEYQMTGNERWAASGVQNNDGILRCDGVAAVLPPIKDSYDAYCTHFPAVAPGGVGTWVIYNTATSVGLRIRWVFETVDELVAFLSEQRKNGTPVSIKYPLAAPIETPLSEAEIAAYRALRSNYPNTTVLNDAGAHMVVKYAADTKLYIDNKIKEALQ